MAVDAAPMAVDAAPVTVADAAVASVPIDAAPPKPTLAERIDKAFSEGRFADTFAACSERVPSASATRCTQAACQLGEASKAKAWLAKVSSSKRSDVIAACKQNGVDLAPRVVRPKTDAGVIDCVKEPMACQH